jgi:4-alpha-glucanotransferase
MKFERSGGILLHPTSLPGRFGIGDLGPQAHGWVDYLADCGCGLWQVLPLGPTGYGDSPYQCFSAFAGNPYLISPQALLQEGLLHANDIIEEPGFSSSEIDYGAVIPWKLRVLDQAYERFKKSAPANLRQQHQGFQEAHRHWLPDYALFMAIKEDHGGGTWVQWPQPLRQRDPEALEEARQQYQEAIQRHIFRQFVFYSQWSALKTHAECNNIVIIGDIPIFVAHDSTDVWAHPELFYLDPDGNPTVVAGVPPDYFSETGQLWGNPLYRWEAHREKGYDWWLNRFRAVLELVDIVRLDHFRGFAGYWEVPGDAKTAEKGRWVKGPGTDLFWTVRKELGELPIIAEDLGVITPDVVEMRETFNLPGMRVLQFGFSGDPDDPFLPHNYPVNCVVYTGTHDNDTVRGWYKRVDEDERSFYRRYLARDGSDVAWDLIRACWSSVAVFALAPMQDFLDLGNEARMNYPGNPGGNWTWRMHEANLSEALQDRIHGINTLYSRLAKIPTAEDASQQPASAVKDGNQSRRERESY